jgi:hypothetical protein
MYLDILQRVGAAWQTLNSIQHVLYRHELQRVLLLSKVLHRQPTRVISSVKALFPQISKVMVDKKKIAGKSKGKAPVSQATTMAK